jgi:hypothetical protein
MRRRRLLLLGAGLLALIGLAALAMMWATVLSARPEPGITAENFRTIRAGMSENEVVTLLGCPAGDYRSDRELREVRIMPTWLIPGDDSGTVVETLETWASDAVVVRVRFNDKTRTVIDADMDGESQEPKGIWDRLRALLGW